MGILVAQTTKRALDETHKKLLLSKPMNKKTRAMALILEVVIIVSLLASKVIPFLAK